MVGSEPAIAMGGGALLDIPCMVSKECVCYACDLSVHLDVTSIGFVYVCQKLFP